MKYLGVSLGIFLLVIHMDVLFGGLKQAFYLFEHGLS